MQTTFANIEIRSYICHLLQPHNSAVIDVIFSHACMVRAMHA